jgi:nucleoside-diphosphate-sugar epimerase
MVCIRQGTTSRQLPPALPLYLNNQVPSRVNDRRQRHGAAVEKSRRRGSVKLAATALKESTLTRLLIVPLGYVTSAVASLCIHRKDKEAGWEGVSLSRLVGGSLPVTLTARYRHEAECAAYSQLFRDGVCLLPLEPVGRDDWESATHLLLSAEYVSWLEQALSERPSSTLCWIGLLSSTSLYSETLTEWIDESSTLDLSRGKAAVCWRAEAKVAELARIWGLSLAIFRLGAVYGPIPPLMRGLRGWTRRSVLDTLFADGEWRGGNDMPLRSRHKVVNRIHVADAGRLLLHGIARSAEGVYNLVDDEPATRAVVEAYAKQCVTKGRPMKMRPTRNVTDHDDLPANPESTGGGKKIRNDRAKSELLDNNMTLWFPSYQEGIRAIAAGDCFPFDVEEKPS